jgi:hypothetical protein
VRASDFDYIAFEDLNFEEMVKGTNNEFYRFNTK